MHWPAEADHRRQAHRQGQYIDNGNILTPIEADYSA
jgi:hypothetical protein